MSPDRSGVVNEELRAVLSDVRHDAAEAQVADDAEAEVARADGVMPAYFDLAVHLELADVCWALGDWDEARRWYRHNTAVMQEKRAWHEEHSGADYPIDATIDWEAATAVKAGDLDAARRLLPRAIRVREQRPGSELVLSRLGLHAAQAGLTDLVPAAGQVVAARQQLPGDGGPKAEDVRAHLHYEPAEVDLLLGRWEPFVAGAEHLDQVAATAAGGSVAAFPARLQDALVAAAHGLSLLAALGRGRVDPATGRDAARDAFESAMLDFVRFSEQVDVSVYFMRLNDRFAAELAAGEVIDPNPFAAGD